MQIQYGNIAIDTAKFHPMSIDAMVRRGVSHYLGNEMASKVVAWAEVQTKAGNPPTDEQKQAQKELFQAEALAALEAGTVGQGASRGPRVDPVTAQIAAITKREVLTILRNQGVKPPKKVDDLVTFGDGTTRTMEQMTVKWLAGNDVNGSFGQKGLPNEPRIRKEAEKHVAEIARKERKAKEAASIGPVAASDLGF